MGLECQEVTSDRRQRSEDMRRVEGKTRGRIWSVSLDISL